MLYFLVLANVCFHDKHIEYQKGKCNKNLTLRNRKHGHFITPLVLYNCREATFIISQQKILTPP